MPLSAPVSAKRRFACGTLSIALLCFFSALNGSAQTYNTLATFGAYGGYWPENTSLTQGRNGDIYGTFTTGGATGNGMIFKITSQGAFTELYSFCVQVNPCSDGSSPIGGLTLGPDEAFYGTTFNGGAYNAGTVFKITPAGKLTTLYSFCAEGFPCADGGYPIPPWFKARTGVFMGRRYMEE